MEQIAISCYDGREGKTNVLLHYADGEQSQGTQEEGKPREVREVRVEV